MMPAPESQPLYDHTIVVEAGKAERRYWQDLWLFRELFWVMAWRDIAVRYKQAVFGVAWAVIQPAMSVIIMTVVFGRLAGLDEKTTTPYPILTFSGVLAWNFFSSAIQNISGSLVGNAQVVRKIYFPRLVLPASSAIVSVVDFGISLVLFGVVLAWYAYLPPWEIIFLPLVVLWTALLSLGAGLWFATLNAEYRDFRFVVPYMVQVGLYVSPVGMDSNIIPAGYRLLYSLNPMAGVIDAMRWCTIHDYQLYAPSIFISLSVTAVLLYTGLKYFRSRERAVADVL